MKVTLYMAIALNGAVATGQGETPWGEVSWQNFVNFANHCGNMLIGARTYEGMKADNDFSRFDENLVLVVVTNSDHKPDDNAAFVSSPEAGLKLLANLGHERALVGGGPGLATSMIENDQIDELDLDIEPILLGKGLEFISKDFQRKLKLLSVQQYDQDGITVKYSVEKSHE